MRKITHSEASCHDIIQSTAFENAGEFRQRKLVVFERNCRMLAERVAVGQIRLIDAADMLQSAAELSGLCEIVGDDLVQEVLAKTFTCNQAGVSK